MGSTPIRDDGVKMEFRQKDVHIAPMRDSKSVIKFTHKPTGLFVNAIGKWSPDIKYRLMCQLKKLVNGKSKVI